VANSRMRWMVSIALPPSVPRASIAKTESYWAANWANREARKGQRSGEEPNVVHGGR
jgi:hypothetical protein